MISLLKNQSKYLKIKCFKILYPENLSYTYTALTDYCQEMVLSLKLITIIMFYINLIYFMCVLVTSLKHFKGKYKRCYVDKSMFLCMY